MVQFYDGEPGEVILGIDNDPAWDSGWWARTTVMPCISHMKILASTVDEKNYLDQLKKKLDQLKKKNAAVIEQVTKKKQADNEILNVKTREKNQAHFCLSDASNALRQAEELGRSDAVLIVASIAGILTLICLLSIDWLGAIGWGFVAWIVAAAVTQGIIVLSKRSAKRSVDNARSNYSAKQTSWEEINDRVNNLSKQLSELSDQNNYIESLLKELS